MRPDCRAARRQWCWIVVAVAVSATAAADIASAARFTDAGVANVGIAGVDVAGVDAVDRLATDRCTPMTTDRYTATITDRCTATTTDRCTATTTDRCTAMTTDRCTATTTKHHQHFPATSPSQASHSSCHQSHPDGAAATTKTTTTAKVTTPSTTKFTTPTTTKCTTLTNAKMAEAYDANDDDRRRKNRDHIDELTRELSNASTERMVAQKHLRRLLLSMREKQSYERTASEKVIKLMNNMEHAYNMVVMSSDRKREVQQLLERAHRLQNCATRKLQVLRRLMTGSEVGMVLMESNKKLRISITELRKRQSPPV